MKYVKNPWKKLSSRIIYQNPWIRLREDQVITPTGTKGIYGVVDPYPAIGIVPISKDGFTYLIGQYRYTLNIYSWEIPEGGGQAKESIFQGAQRELLEETGFKASKWAYLGSAYTSNSFTNEVAYLYLAWDLTAGKTNPDHTEQLEIRKVKFTEAWEMVEKGIIKDAMSIIGLLRAKMLLEKWRWLK
ncbi:NUDIX domain-containing protein [Calditrichota bacterium LG25]